MQIAHAGAVQTLLEMGVFEAMPQSWETGYRC
jgi:hypothetical protein